MFGRDDLDDQQSLRRLKRGDIRALDALMERYQVRALRAAYLVTQDVTSAEDVVQDAFVSAYRSISTFDASRPFAPWFMRIVINGAIRASRRTHQSLEETEDSGDWVDAAPGPDEQIETAETEEAIWNALGLLTAERRAVIVLKYYLELTETEAAEQLNIPVGTVKSRLHMARQQLRALLTGGEGHGRQTSETNLD